MGLEFHTCTCAVARMYLYKTIQVGSMISHDSLSVLRVTI